MVLGIYLLASTFFADDNQKLRIWFCVSLLPISLVISYSGMEYSLVVFLTCMAIYYSFKLGHITFLSYIALFALPWARPDAIAFGFVVFAFTGLYYKQFPQKMLFSLLLGFLTWIGFNYWYFGSLLTQSIEAKSINSNFCNPELFFRHLKEIFFGFQTATTWGIGGAYAGLFSPINTRYLAGYGFLFFLLSISFYIWCAIRSMENRQKLVLVSLLIVLSICPPIVYAFGGVIWTWYFWPSTFFGAFLCLLLFST